MVPSHERPTFFIDRCLGTRDVARALRGAEAKVEIHDDHFDEREEDEVWLPFVAARGWAILTKDDRIRRSPLQRTSLIEAKAAALFLTSGDLSGAQMAEAFRRALHRMEHVLGKYDRPLIATVNRDGRVVVLVGIRRGNIRRGR